MTDVITDIGDNNTNNDAVYILVRQYVVIEHQYV